jgi:hypothetical protein
METSGTGVYRPATGHPQQRGDYPTDAVTALDQEYSLDLIRRSAPYRGGWYWRSACAGWDMGDTELPVRPGST